MDLEFHHPIENTIRDFVCFQYQLPELKGSVEFRRKNGSYEKNRSYNREVMQIVLITVSDKDGGDL